MPNYQLLSHSPVFMGLHPDKIEQLLKKILYQVKKYPKDYLVANKIGRASCRERV